MLVMPRHFCGGITFELFSCDFQLGPPYFVHCGKINLLTRGA